VLLDIEDETEFVPLRTLRPTRQRATSSTRRFPKRRHGFEYGYSRDYPKLWFCGKRSSAILRTWRRRD